MDASKLSRIANFIWGCADDALRDLYVRGKYRDVILPMTVLRRLDALLPPMSVKPGQPQSSSGNFSVRKDFWPRTPMDYSGSATGRARSR